MSYKMKLLYDNYFFHKEVFLDMENKENRIFYQEDCNLSLLEGKKIAIIGYGSQGHAHALNLKDSGCDVIIGLYEGSKSWAKAESQGLKVYTAAEAAKQADIIMILINDELQAAMYKKDVEPILEAGNMLMFAHGFNIHFGTMVPPKDVDVTMVAPKGPATSVRSEYQICNVFLALSLVTRTYSNALDWPLAPPAGSRRARSGVLDTHSHRYETASSASRLSFRRVCALMQAVSRHYAKRFDPRTLLRVHP